MAIAFNVEPYWDDFETAGADGLSPKEKYQKILFRPGKAVQARELTQLQSSLQNQISSTGDHVFKDGSVVIPGAVHLHNKIDYIKLDSVHANNDTVAELVGTEFTDGTNVAKVIHAALASGSDPITLWVQYISGTVFADNATITASGSKSAEVKASAATGFGSIVSIEDGIYYIKKHFVVTKAKTIVLSKYTSSVSFDIGLLVTESLVNSGGDASLNDNATGTPNESAPGAHRYSITAVLSTQAVNASSGNFVLIARLESGVITKHARSPDYNELEDVLARRTFDESGNYYVNPFKTLVKTHQASSPDATKLSLAVEPSKAYVRGYEIQTLATTNVHFDRARTSERVTDKVTEITHNNYIEVTSMVGTPDITTFGKIDIENSSGVSVGTCRARSIERVSGNGASSASRYRIHIFDFTGTMTLATQLDDREGTAAGTTFAATIADSGATTAYNIGSDSLVYPLPYDRIKTCNSEVDDTQPDDFNYRYETNRIFTQATVSAGLTATFTAAAAGEQFGTIGANTNWILINDTDSTVGGEEVLVGDITINNGASPPNVIIANLPAAGKLVRLIAPVIKTTDHKTKTLVVNQAVAFNALDDFTGTGMALGHADIYRIVSVEETVGSADVTEHFDLDNGQTDTHYGIGRVKLKTTSNYTATSSNSVALTVTYDYFSHSSGDFFTVDSYVGIDYADIPKHDGVELRSAVDFRPRVSNAGGNYTGTGAQTAFAPIRYSQFETDIQLYLARMDKVYINSAGVFGVSPGVPSRNAKAPGIPKDAMHLYTLSIPPYTLTPGEVGVEYIDQRRYTMRDIGHLDTRIGQVEYYAALNFLETEAQNKQILDTASPYSLRWKSGYLVDGFANTRMSNSGSPEYRASVDIPNRTLRPSFSQGNAALAYHAAGSGTTKTGDLITLPYTSSAIISQTQYSGTINVNPYDVFNWTGSVALAPSTDEWMDIDRRPEVVINNDGEFDAMVAALQPQLGTVWGSWETHWTGGGQQSHESYYTPGPELPHNPHGVRSRGTWSFVETTTPRIRSGKKRTGIQTTIAVETSRVSQGDRTVEVNFVPYMRTRLVHFTATRMMPNTTVYAYFDGVDISSYVSETQPGYTPLVGINSVVAHPSGAGALTTDANGAVSGSFLIPNNSATKFTAGTKEFKLTSDNTNNDALTRTTAFADFTAAGLIETVENVIISTRTPVLQRNSVGSGVVSWSDPLAQSILLDKATFVTSLGLYFVSKDDNIPVQIQIRKMVNGFPTQEVVPFSDVTLNPSAVTADGSTVTNFTFPSPVFLQDKIEYAIVILANSNNYTVRYAEIGGEDQSGNRISQQPYNGVLFKSQNASTWTADQNKDLTFVLNRAVFDTSVSRTCVLRNAALPSRALTNNPITTTNASTNITVAHRDHGMKIADSVTIAGVDATVNGHTTTHLNTTHTITAITRDTYTFVSAGTGSSTGIGGGTLVQATQHLAWNTIHPIIQQVVLPDTTQTWTVKDSLESSGTITATAAAITANEDYTPLYPKVIKPSASPDHTIEFSGTFNSTSDFLSPVIDLERCSAITISNRIDNNVGAVAETTPGEGTSLAKYVTKTVELNDSSDTIKVYVDINRPNGSFVDLYYKSGNTASTFDAQNWILATNDLSVVAFSDGSSYEETVYTITPADTFTLFNIKIVFRSTGTSYVPKVQQLRAIACKV
jgi:hypothetical protein